MRKSLNPSERFVGIHPQEGVGINQIDRLPPKPKAAHVFYPFAGGIQSLRVQEFRVLVYDKLLSCLISNANSFRKNCFFLHGES